MSWAVLVLKEYVCQELLTLYFYYIILLLFYNLCLVCFPSLQLLHHPHVTENGLPNNVNNFYDEDDDDKDSLLGEASWM